MKAEVEGVSWTSEGEVEVVSSKNEAAEGVCEMTAAVVGEVS